MCYLIGFLSLLQVTFLPGFLILRSFKLNLNFVRVIIFSFGLSLIANYLGVFFLTSLGFYNRKIVFIVFSIEILAISFLYFSSIFEFLKKPFFPQIESIRKKIMNFFVEFIKKYKNTNLNNFCFLIFLGAILCLGWIILLFFNNLSNFSVISGIDDVGSWNRWAIDWFNGMFPFRTYEYPQLIPTNWSLSYLFINAPIQFFPKIFMPLFLLYILILTFDLGILKKSIGYFVAIIATTLIFMNSLGNFVTSGYVDIPVAFMAFLSIYCLLLAQDIKDKVAINKYIVLGAIIAAGSAVTK